MTKVGIVGDSHIVALKLAWDELKNQFSDTELYFCGAGGKATNQLKVTDNKLFLDAEKATVPNGANVELELNEIDKVVLVGMQTTDIIVTERILKDCSVAYQARSSSDRVLSRNCFSEVISSYVRNSNLVRTYNIVKHSFRNPIYYVNIPLTSSVYLDQDVFEFYENTNHEALKARAKKIKPEIEHLMKFARNGDWRELYFEYRRAYQDLLGAEIIEIPQDEHTVFEQFFTKEYYCAQDLYHGNRHYGRKQMEKVLQFVS